MSGHEVADICQLHDELRKENLVFWMVDLGENLKCLHHRSLDFLHVFSILNVWSICSGEAKKWRSIRLGGKDKK